jgi:amidophosphoribosyltransferase
MCGIYARLSYFSSPCTLGKIRGQLEKLRHRGNDGIGVAIENREKEIFCIKCANVDDFPQDRKESGPMGIGHVRYRTKGFVDDDSCQPLLHGNIALVHNGHIKTTMYEPDSLVILSYFLQYPQKSVFQIAEELMRDIPDGSYSCIIMIAGYGLVALRDPRGIRPLVYHHNKDRTVIASESIVITQNVRDVEPGECIVFEKNGVVSHQYCGTPDYTPCIFEYIYFAHKNSYINQIHVYAARQALGELLARRVNAEDYDVIVPVPKTSCVSAKEMSRRLGVPYRELLTVRKGRSFILPKQTIRISLIKEKFNLDEEQCRDKRILLVDDSIVRGTTMRSLVKRFRAAGVTRLDIASCAPPVYSPNVYGIDISSADELVANQGDVAELLGADRVIYQDFDEMCAGLLELNDELDGWECSMFLK